MQKKKKRSCSSIQSRKKAKKAWWVDERGTWELGGSLLTLTCAHTHKIHYISINMYYVYVFTADISAESTYRHRLYIHNNENARRVIIVPWICLLLGINILMAFVPIPSSVTYIHFY